MKKGVNSNTNQYLHGRQSRTQNKPVRAELNHSKKCSQQLQSFSKIDNSIQNHTYSQIIKQPTAHNFAKKHNRTQISTHNRKEYSSIHISQRQGAPTSQAAIALLRERLKNIQEHYQTLLLEEKNKNEVKSEVIMGVIDELQDNHLLKVEQMRRMIAQSEQQKKDAGFVDQKMLEIRRNIEELISQSNGFKAKNDELSKKIEKKIKQNKEKETQLEDLNAELLETRNQLEQFQIANLRHNKFNRQIMEILNTQPKSK